MFYGSILAPGALDALLGEGPPPPPPLRWGSWSFSWPSETGPTVTIRFAADSDERHNGAVAAEAEEARRWFDDLGRPLAPADDDTRLDRGGDPVKIVQVRPLGLKDGQPHYRLKVRSEDGATHRVRCPASVLAHPLTLRRHLLERTGRDLVPPGTGAGDLARHLADALVPAASAPTGPAGTVEFGGADPGPAVRQLVSVLYGELAKMVNSGSGDPDEVADLLDRAVERLAEIDG